MLREKCPHLVGGGLDSEQERSDTFAVQGQLHDLASYIDHFKSALSLLDTAQHHLSTPSGDQERIGVLSDWKLIAARDGAMTIFHFGDTLQLVRKTVGLCKTLLGLIDPKALKRHCDYFESQFRNFDSLRHSVSHDATTSRYLQKKNNANVFSGVMASEQQIDAPNMRIRGALFGRKFVRTHEIAGRMVEVSYELSVASLAELVKVAERYYETFQPAELPLKDLMLFKATGRHLT